MIEQFVEQMQNRVNRSQPTATSAVGGDDARPPFSLGIVTAVDTDNDETLYEVAMLNAAGSVVRHFLQVTSWQDAPIGNGKPCILLFPNGPDEVPVIISGGGASVSAAESVALVINREPLYSG